MQNSKLKILVAAPGAALIIMMLDPVRSPIRGRIGIRLGRLTSNGVDIQILNLLWRDISQREPDGGRETRTDIF